jgi:hypothetical protein
MRSKICGEARVGYARCTCDPESESAGMGGLNRPPTVMGILIAPFVLLSCRSQGPFDLDELYVLLD